MVIAAQQNLLMASYVQTHKHVYAGYFKEKYGEDYFEYMQAFMRSVELTRPPDHCKYLDTCRIMSKLILVDESPDEAYKLCCSYIE